MRTNSLSLSLSRCMQSSVVHAQDLVRELMHTSACMRTW